VALTKRVEVLFDPEQFREVERIALSQGGSVASLVRAAVERQFLQPRLSERRRAVQRLLSMETGVTWEEVKKELEADPGRRIEAS
jgi:hypothetical protein